MPDEDVMTWRGLVRPDEVAGVTAAGSDAVRWAVDVHERFFGDAWLLRAGTMRIPCLPFLAGGLWPVTGPGPVMRLVERACQLDLVQNDWENLRAQVFQNRPGEAVTHLRLVLETAGWAFRDGYNVEFEPELGTRKRPDVLIHTGDRQQVLIEVTSQTQDKAMRAVRRYGELVQRLTWAIESDHQVAVTMTSERPLDDGDVHAWFGAVASAAGRVASGGPIEKVQWEENVATVHPSGTQLTDIHVGPSLSGDAWPRLADRLAQKAGQTSGGPPAWIRVEVDYSLFALTNLASLEPEARLRALAWNVAIALVDAPHVLGVVLGPPRGIGAGDDERLLLPSAEDPTRLGLVLPTPVFRERAVASGPTAVRCALPGGWARTTFVLPNPACDAEDPLRPGTVLAAEGGWLDWALDRLGMPGTAALVR